MWKGWLVVENHLEGKIKEIYIWWIAQRRWVTLWISAFLSSVGEQFYRILARLFPAKYLKYIKIKKKVFVESWEWFDPSKSPMIHCYFNVWTAIRLFYFPISWRSNMGLEIMKDFTSIEVLPCNKSTVFIIYPFKGHSYFKSYFLNINHFNLSFPEINSINHLGFCRRGFILGNIFISI